MFNDYITGTITFYWRSHYIDDSSRITGEVGINCCWNQVDLLLLLSVHSWLDFGIQECNGSSLPASAPLSLISPPAPQVSLQLSPYRPYIAHPFPVRSDRKTYRYMTFRRTSLYLPSQTLLINFVAGQLYCHLQQWKSLAASSSSPLSQNVLAGE